MIKVSVLYPNSENLVFDKEYYLDKHVPLVSELLGEALKNVQVESSDLEFLSSNSKNKSEETYLLELSFEILKDVYMTKKEEANAKAKARETKEFNQKIMSLIAEKQESSLKDKSIEELMAMIQ